MPSDLDIRIIWAFLAVFVLVLLADFVLLMRWLLYQLRLQSAVQHYGLVFDAMPDVPPTVPAPAAIDAGEDVRAAGEPTPVPYAVVPPPFARKWSLTHPFLGLQAVLLFTVLSVLAAGLVLGLLGVRFNLTGSVMSGGVLWLTIASLFVQNALFVAIPAFFFARYGVGLKGVGLYRPQMPRIGRDLLMGLGLGVVMLAFAWGVEVGVVAALKALFGAGVVDSLQRVGKTFDAAALFSSLSGFWPKFLFLLGGAVAAPIGEEVFFRGFVYTALKHRLGVAAAVVLSGLIFALIHASPLGVLVIFPMGMLLAYVYERTGSLWVTITIHAVNNGVAFLSLWFGMGSGK